MNRENSTALILTTALASFVSACAAMQPPDASGPRNLGPQYPILFVEQPARTEASVGAFNRLTQTSNTQPGIQLQPITSAIKNLPANFATPLYLPKVGTAEKMTEEETRESLRRFLNDWRELIGANPEHLSLVERTDRPDGVMVAVYQQRPFRFPLRGGYGFVEISFSPNRALRNLTSTCIPDAEHVQPSLSQIVPKLSAEEAIKLIQPGAVVNTNANVAASTQVSSGEEIKANELVTYVIPAPGRTDALELHIAWEISVGANSNRLVYVDAVEGTVLGSGP